MIMTVSSSQISNAKPLSATELFDISNEISRKFSPVISVKSSNIARRLTLTPKELKEISEEISRIHKPIIKTITSNVVVMPIDPDNLYVSWNLGQAETISVLDNKPKDFVLRVYPIKEKFSRTPLADVWFDIDLDQTKTRQKVPFPSGQHASSYTAAIGLRDEDNQLITFATSNTLHTLRGNKTANTKSENKTLSIYTAQVSSNQDGLQTLIKSASSQFAK